ncbi:hypothetical protein IFM89_027237 [Coptis chinensis]|uniref:ABC transporter C family member 10 n=1 Tax=Coptis chinensis TaxID=261450 RepID=A0A835I5P6_9MAGN|nr:hypothetical protein IFM89_027237 [Coptis chinensis]
MGDCFTTALVVGGIVSRCYMVVCKFNSAVMLLLCAFRNEYEETGQTIKGNGVYTHLNGETDGSSITDSDTNISPFAKAGFFSTMSFWWLNPLMKMGKEKTLEDEDIPQMREVDCAKSCYSLFMEQLNIQRQIRPSNPPSILWTIIRQWYFRSRIVGLQVRSLLSAAIFKKQMRLSNAAKLKHSSGEIMNYVTVDAYRIGEFPYWFQTWTTSLQLCIALGILIHAVGIATIAALFVIVLTVLCNTPLAKLQHKFQTKLMEAQDERLKATSEALVNMKVLKLYAWETHFKNVIEKLRKEECKWLSAVQLRKAYNGFLFYSSPVLVSAATFGACYFLGIPLYARSYKIRTGVIGVVIQANVALVRIIRFLEAPELQNGTVRQKLNVKELKNSVFINSANFSWEENHLKPTLRNVNLEVKPGEKVAICGEVGSGKSTLLAAILGEVSNAKGKEYVMEALSGKTVLLVTHQVDFLPTFDSVLLMSDGEILHAAPYHQLLATSQEFQVLVNAHKETAGSERLHNVVSSLRTAAPTREIKKAHNEKQLAASADQLIKLEERESGDTGLKPYLQYLNQNKGYIYFSFACLGHFVFVAGQILQNSWMAAKVSADLSIVDLDVPFNLILAVGATTNTYANLGVLAVVTWQVLFVSIPMVFLAICLQQYYFASAKELMRINGTTKSMLANHLAESIAGAITIRAFQKEDRFFAQNLDLIDTNASPFFHNFAANEWLIERLEILSATVISSSALAMVLLPPGTFSPDPILHLFPRVSAAQLKVGTRLGLSDILAVGKQLLSVPCFVWWSRQGGGGIVIDGLDISTIGLHDLRSRFGIIPQDPTLFNGTVLRKCQLEEAVQDKEEGLDAPVVEDGLNWSMGQRQLFCLGRALLRRSRILVLDEATASIDNATDRILQKTIRTEFADCTVITVAHRIPTVMDCTMVLAISDGKLVEYDEPMNLMNREGSLFGQLVKEYWSHSEVN